MGIIADTFVQEFLDALPEGMARDLSSSNAMFGAAVGEAVEKAIGRVTPERHVHYHVPEGAVLHAVGDVVQIGPWMPAAKASAPEAPAAEPAGDPMDTWPATGGPLDGQTITTEIKNEIFVHDVDDGRNTYRRAKLVEGGGFEWVFSSYEGLSRPVRATG